MKVYVAVLLGGLLVGCNRQSLEPAGKAQPGSAARRDSGTVTAREEGGRAATLTEDGGGELAVGPGSASVEPDDGGQGRAEGRTTAPEPDVNPRDMLAVGKEAAVAGTQVEDAATPRDGGPVPMEAGAAGQSVPSTEEKPPFLIGLIISPSLLQLCFEESYPLDVTAHWSDGSQTHVSHLASYSWDVDGAVSVDESGTVTLLGSLPVTVRAEYAGTVDSVFIGAPVCDGCVFLGPVIAGPVIVSMGESLQLTASYCDLNVTPSLDWRMEPGGEAIAEVDERGILTGVAPGETWVLASFEGSTNRVSVTVLPGDAGAGDASSADGAGDGGASDGGVPDGGAAEDASLVLGAQDGGAGDGGAP